MSKETDVVEEPKVEPSTEEPSTPTEQVSSPQEVKPEVVETPAVETPKDESKLAEQVQNLNIALKQERESAKVKTEEFEKKLEDSNAVTERLKNAFIDPEEVQPTEQPAVSTDDLVTMKEELKEEIRQETADAQKVEGYKKEISDLETEWNGEDGKPKYIDDDVLKWQQDNNKTYLSPSDAFNAMKKDEIIDYAVKQRISGANSAENVEQPTSTPGTHTPPSPSEETSEIDTRKAIMEAMETAEKEM